jgi:hypothetical protein
MDYQYHEQIYSNSVVDMIGWLKANRLPISGDDLARIKAAHRA